MKKSTFQFFSGVCKHLVIIVLLFSCSEDPTLWEAKSKDQVITQYIESNPEYSEFAKILDETGLSSLLSVRGPFTLFLPTDDAMMEYYTMKGVSSYKDFSDPEFLSVFVKNHLVPSSIASGDIGLGAIRDTNVIGDYLVTEFEGSDIIINKHSKIIDRDVIAANGTIHIIDKAIDPVTISIYDFLANNPDYSLFSEGLKRTRLKDTLQIITFPYGNKMARTRFTVLAVPDSTFEKNGITNINELISRFTDYPDSVTYLNNGFYRYMEYHCMGETYYLNNLESKLYPILSYDNNISLLIDNIDYKINLNKQTHKYTGFVIEASNNPTKNGAVHTINDLLPVFEPEPSTIVFETTSFWDMRQGDYYLKYYMRWFDGQNTFAYIKWEGDYMLYYYKPDTESWNLHADCLSMSGWWWVELTVPKIMKGRYKVSGNIWNGEDKSNYDVYVDGVKTVYVANTQPAITTSWGEFNWLKTETHKIKVIAKSPGMLFWDTIVFTPIK
jgi:uncharacterized surface protein with fasciclin (FAS1) repeats